MISQLMPELMPQIKINKTMNRRNFIGRAAFAPLFLGAPSIIHSRELPRKDMRIRFSVNAYSFNSMLRSGEMTFFDMMEFAADIGLDAVDLTGYYFSTYPETPGDDELYELKLKALELGLNITWTGVRNDFVTAESDSRKQDREMIRQWLGVSSKLGASIMRVFPGTGDPGDYSREAIKERMVEDFRICAGYARQSGVMLGLQHHNDFLYSGEEIIDILERVNSPWFGLILDTGSLHAEDPYNEIKKLAPYANYWFIKEHVYPGGVKTPVDIELIGQILSDTGYRGYVSFESLSEDDPKVIIRSMSEALRTALVQM